MELPSYIMKAIDKERKNYKEKELNRLKSMFTLNPQTNRYDYDGNLYRDILSNFVSEDRDGFIINFGKVTGNFDCSIIGLKPLKGAPQEVGGSFDCSWNYLISLEGAPQKVGRNFKCSENQLTSLEGAPQKVSGSFRCYNNQLTSLEGAPTEIDEDFWCSYNQLTSLKGAPQTIGRDFYCEGNPNLHSLDGIGEVRGDIFKDF